MTSPHKNQHRGGLNCVDKTPMPVVFRKFQRQNPPDEGGYEPQPQIARGLTPRPDHLCASHRPNHPQWPRKLDVYRNDLMIEDGRHTNRENGAGKKRVSCEREYVRRHRNYHRSNFVEAACDNLTFENYLVSDNRGLARYCEPVCRILRSGLQRHIKDSGAASADVIPD